MNGENERSVASDGSVVAWAVMDGTKTLVGYHSCSRDKAEAWAKEYGFPEVVPLYRHPPCQDFSQKNLTLTDAERDAVLTAAWEADAHQHTQRADTLRGLLERMK